MEFLSMYCFNLCCPFRVLYNNYKINALMLSMYCFNLCCPFRVLYNNYKINALMLFLEPSGQDKSGVSIHSFHAFLY